MRRDKAQPGGGPALTKDQREGQPEGPGRPRGRAERGGAPARARGGVGRTAARPVPIRPASERRHRLALSGLLAHDSAPALEAAIDELCDAGIGELVLDMGALHGVDATGARVVAMRCELCRRRGIAVRVERLAGEAREAFASAGLLSRLPLAAPSPAAPGRPSERHDENPLRKRGNVV